MHTGTDDFSRLELSLKGCMENYRYFRSLLEPRTKLLVLVKANAYGHGAVEFAAMMQRAGADYLAVAYPVEGLELRKNGISLPILVLTYGFLRGDHRHPHGAQHSKSGLPEDSGGNPPPARTQRLSGSHQA